jgi:hypothetical protein
MSQQYLTRKQLFWEAYGMHCKAPVFLAYLDDTVNTLLAAGRTAIYTCRKQYLTRKQLVWEAYGMHGKASVFLASLDDTCKYSVGSKKDRYLHMSQTILNSLYFATCALSLLMLYSLYLFVFIKPAVLFSSLFPFSLEPL